MTNKELIKRLLDFDPDSQVAIVCSNGILNTYAFADDLSEVSVSLESVECFHGLVDDRLNVLDSAKFIFISSSVDASVIQNN